MDRRYLQSLLAGAAALTFAACSGASGVMPRSNLVPSLPQSDASGAVAKTQKVKIVISWSGAHRSLREPTFTSPSAKSIRIDASGPNDASSTTIVEKPAKAVTSTISVEAPVGNDTFTFTVFDLRNAEGNELGGATVRRTVRSGRVTTIRTTFVGYASAFEIVSKDRRFAPTGLASGGVPVYTVSGQAEIPFSVTEEDADGNVILAPGAPAIHASSDAPAAFTVRAVKGKPGSFTIQTVGPVPAGGNPHLVVEAAGANGVTASESYPLGEVSLLYASAGSGATAHVYAFNTLGRQFSLPGTFPGIDRPVALAYDDARKRIYVADAGASKLFAYDENGNAIKTWTAPVVPGIDGVAVSNTTGYVYVSTNSGNGAVDVFGANGAPVQLHNAFAGLHAAPVGIAEYGGTVAVAETGNPGYVDLFTDLGVPVALGSGPLTSLDGFPFTPVAISAADGGEQGVDFWISGTENYSFPPSEGGSGSDPMVAAFTSYNVRPFWASVVDNAGGSMDYYSTNGLITSPLGLTTNPAKSTTTGDFYLWQASGPLLGFDCSSTCTDPAPAQISGIPGEVPIIRTPKGVSNFTAAVFSQY